MKNDVVRREYFYRWMNTNDQRIYSHDDRADEAEEYIRHWPSHSHEKVIPDGIAKISGIGIDRFAPPEANQKNHQEPNIVDMGQRIWCQSSLQTRRRISELIRAPRMSVLMQADWHY